MSELYAAGPGFANRALLFLDTETTGVDSNARMVEIAFQLDDFGNTIFQYNTLIKPSNFEIPWPTTQIHGVSTTVAREYGQELVYVLYRLAKYLTYSRDVILIAHNLDFDRRIISYDAEQIGQILSWPQTFCTMKALTQHCRLPKKTGQGYKWPSLAEAYTFLFEKPPPAGLHSARIDMLTCREIFYEGRRRGLWKL